MNERYIEILSPAGSFDSITAAVNSGCNAVYLGGRSFNARNYADNFSDEELEKVIRYCHLRGVRVSVTVNTLYKNSEFPELLKFIEKLYQYGADSLIIQDIGLFSVIRNRIAGVALHASTQMTVHNLKAAAFLHQEGFERIVLSRELSLEEIEEICEKSGAEIECFVHGALCVCYSGRCLLSSVIGGRSGNRGRCAQPCRLPYTLCEGGKEVKKGYLISPRDILTADIMDKLINAGITSFKIEGRMKSPEYVAQATSIYRKYADMAPLKFDEKDKEELLQIFSRGGASTRGYYDNWAGGDMISPSPKSSGTKIGKVISFDSRSKRCRIHTDRELVGGDGIEIWTKYSPHTGTNISENISANSDFSVYIKDKAQKGDEVYLSYDKRLNDKLRKFYAKDERRQRIEVMLYSDGENLEITMISQKGDKYLYSEKIVEKAVKNPITQQYITDKITKTGNTPFEFVIKNVEIGENDFIPVSALNTFRRNACSYLEEKLSGKRERINIEYVFPKTVSEDKPKISVSVNNSEQFYAIKDKDIARIYLPLKKEYVENADYFLKNAKNAEIFFAVPSIVRRMYKGYVDTLIKKAENTDVHGFLYKNYDFHETEKKLAFDYTFNVFNSFSVEYLKSFADTVTLSPELSLSEISETAAKGTEVIVYGKLTLMTTHQCPIGIHAANKRKGIYCPLKNKHGEYTLKDRKNAEYPVVTYCEGCTAFILSDKAIFTADKAKSFKNVKPSLFRLDFTTESPETAAQITDMYISVFLNKIYSDKETADYAKNNDFVGFPKGVL